MGTESTTIKLTKKTKARLDNLKEYKRESYEEVLQKMLDILNLCRVNPSGARARLLSIDRQRRLSMHARKLKRAPEKLEEPETSNY
jgi:hypothetical protein